MAIGYTYPDSGNPEDLPWSERPPTPQAASPYNLDAWYQKTLGRAPDANERASDMANIEKYGAAGFESDFQKRLGSGPQQPNYQTPAQQWNSQPQSSQSNDLYRLLMERANQSTAIDRNNPLVRQQVDPMVAQQQRASRSYLDALAEKAGPLANLQGERRLAAERQGQAAGALESEVIGRLSNDTLQERMQALGLAQQYGSAQDRNALEREIAYLMDASRGADRDLQRYGMNQSNDQFLRELSLRQYDLFNNWDYQWQTLGL